MMARLHAEVTPLLSGLWSCAVYSLGNTTSLQMSQRDLGSSTEWFILISAESLKLVSSRPVVKTTQTSQEP